MNRSIALGLAMVASSVIGATAVNGLHAQNKAPGAYAALDLRAINSPDVFKTLPSKTGDFDGYTARLGALCSRSYRMTIVLIPSLLSKT